MAGIISVAVQHPLKNEAYSRSIHMQISGRVFCNLAEKLKDVRANCLCATLLRT